MSVREVAARGFRLNIATSWRFPAVFGSVALVLTALPYIAGSMLTPHDRQFMGIAYDVPDTAQYFAWMRSFAHHNSLLIANPLTPEPNRAIFLNPLWFALGQLGNMLSLHPAVVYQGFRWVAGTAFLAVLWGVCGSFCRPGWERRLAFLLAVFGGGFGWVWVVLKHILHHPVPPTDIYLAEPNTFFSLLAFPHLLFSIALILGLFTLCIRGYETRRWSLFAAAGALGFLIGITHGYDLLIVYMVLCGFVLIISMRHRAIPWLLVGGIALVGAISSPPALYLAYLTQHDPTWSGVLAQYGNADFFTPTPAHLVILLGPVFLVALASLLVPQGRIALWRGPERDLMLVVWFLGSFPLVYVPTVYQIKMLTGWQIPAGILAARGLLRILLPMYPRARAALSGGFSRWPVEVIVGVALVVCAVPTNLYLVAWRSSAIHGPAAPYTIAASDAEALHWLGANASDGDVVLASQVIGEYVAAESDARPVLAHWAQTLRYFSKEADVRRFYATETRDEDRVALLRQWNVRYVLVGPEERALGRFDPSASTHYVRLFTSGATSIYMVQLTDGERGV